jgi:hypothetical protein
MIALALTLLAGVIAIGSLRLLIGTGASYET